MIALLGMRTIYDLPTPALLLDLDVLGRNLLRMSERADSLGVALRPHIKSHKCIEIALAQKSIGARGIAVSTLYEASVFADHGFDDITWAFPLILGRLDEARRLSERVRLGVVIDSPEAVDALERSGTPFRVWLKVDCGYHRAGVDPDSSLALTLARALDGSSRFEFAGILTHSGHAYHGRSPEHIRAIAEDERRLMTEFAHRLREEGVEVRHISVGSTPAMARVEKLDGVTEVRPGNYALCDYTQAALGSCAVSDCAATVLTSVVSTHADSGKCVVDAGALALSKDPGPTNVTRQTFGEVFDDYAGGTLRPDARLVSLSQEHGVVSAAFPVGERLRVLPNHSCLAVACYDRYHVVRGEDVVDSWMIWRGR